MKDFLHFYSGKLYNKESLKNWELPEGIKEQMEYENHEYFFISAAREQDKGKPHGQMPHVHLSIYPVDSEIVYILEVQTARIEPELLYSVLNLLRNEEYMIISSSGYCTNGDKCYFGIWFNTEKENIELDKLVLKIKDIPNVDDAKAAKFTCDGFIDVKS